jgi:hypothetical protein
VGKKLRALEYLAALWEQHPAEMLSNAYADAREMLETAPESRHYCCSRGVDPALPFSYAPLFDCPLYNEEGREEARDVPPYPATNVDRPGHDL